jgi:hypothetical protein
MNTSAWQTRFVLFLLFLSPISSIIAFDGKIESLETKAFSLGGLRSLENEYSNPALIPFNFSGKVGASVLNRFQMKELSTMNVFVSYPNSIIDASAKYSVYGFEDYKLNQAHIGLAKKLTSRLSLGASLIYAQESSILLDASKNNLFADLGVYYSFNENWNFSFLVENFIHTIPKDLTHFFGGASYKGMENVGVYGEVACRFFNEWDFSLGAEYLFLEKLSARAGYSSLSQNPSFGASCILNDFEIEIGFALHSTLGTSCIIGLSYFFT